MNKLDLKSKLVIENERHNEQLFMEVIPDGAENKNLVAISFVEHDRGIILSNNRNEDDTEAEFFWLNKFNLGLLVDYLKNIHSNMKDE